MLKQNGGTLKCRNDVIETFLPRKHAKWKSNSEVPERSTRKKDTAKLSPRNPIRNYENLILRFLRRRKQKFWPKKRCCTFLGSPFEDWSFNPGDRSAMGPEREVSMSNTCQIEARVDGATQNVSRECSEHLCHGVQVPATSSRFAESMFKRMSL
jgi:hypothetical protein